MSAESHSDQQAQSHSVETSGSSAESSVSPSPTGILSPSTSMSASTSSLPIIKPKISFAPLPQLAPRKRRSAVPLGMAARSQLVRRRRGHGSMDDPVSYEAHNPMWTDEEIEQQRAAALNEGRRQFHYVDEDDQEGEDPFVALGRLVKHAGRSIWRRVSHRDLAKKGKESEKDGVKTETEVVDVDEKLGGAGTMAEIELVVTPAPSSPEQQQTPATGTPGTEGPPVQDDGDGTQPFHAIGQTETIREGQAPYEWIAAALDSSTSESPPRIDYHAQ